MANSDANQRWAEQLAGWAIPEELLAAAPQSPYFFDPKVFTAAADGALERDHDTPSDAAAREALGSGAAGTVLDVGVGAGTASLRLRPQHVTGVDPSPAMLEAFAERAARLGVEYTTIEGGWPDAATTSPVADVAVCHHVAYNVSDLATFAVALDAHATRRVVVELTAEHPMAWMRPYWDAMHGLAQPNGPVADDAIAVITELGFTLQHERWTRSLQMIGESDDDQLARIARRLCLPPERHDELRAVVAATPPPREREVVTLWWDTTG